MPRYKEERTFLRPQDIRVSDYCAIGPQRGPDSAISHFLYREYWNWA